MTETHTSERKANRNGQHKPVTVSAVALARHLDCSRSYVQQLEAEGIVQRDGDRFPLDASRVAYLRHLRRERKQSPRGEADTAFTQAKAHLINIRIQEKQKTLVDRAEWTANTGKRIGIVLTHLSGMAARCAVHDLQLRRKIDQCVFDTRVAIAHAFTAMADEAGEPELDQDKADAAPKSV